MQARDLNTQGKVQAVYESVQRNTRYIAFEFGVHSYQPYPVTTVERRGFGDCKDKAAMIVALLRAVGVPAEFAMVRTRSAGDVAPGAYSVQLFNHAMAYVPELDLYPGRDRGICGAGRTSARRPRRHGDDRGCRGASATRRMVPFAPPEANRLTREVQAQLGPDGRVEFAVADQVCGILCGRAAAEQRVERSGRELSGNPGAVLSDGQNRSRGSRRNGAGFAGSRSEDRGEMDATAWTASAK